MVSIDTNAHLMHFSLKYRGIGDLMKARIAALRERSTTLFFTETTLRSSREVNVGTSFLG